MNLLKRSMSMTPTPGSAAAKSSGRCVIVAPTSSPPLLRPPIASLLGAVYFSSMRYSAAAMKSSKTFCLRSLVPAWCHASPNSPPPRRLGIANTPPISIHTTLGTENIGPSGMLNPP